MTVSFQKDTKEPGLESTDWSRLIEGNSGIVSVVLSRPPDQQVTVPLSWTGTGSDAAEASDYEAPASVTFAAGQTRELVSLRAVADEEDEQPEDVQVTLGARPPNGYIAGTPSAFTFKIHDDDGSGVTIEPLSLYVTEGGGPQRYSMVLDTKPEAGSTVILRAHGMGDDLPITKDSVEDDGETFQAGSRGTSRSVRRGRRRGRRRRASWPRASGWRRSRGGRSATGRESGGSTNMEHQPREAAHEPEIETFEQWLERKAPRAPWPEGADGSGAPGDHPIEPRVEINRTAIEHALRAILAIGIGVTIYWLLGD